MKTKLLKKFRKRFELITVKTSTGNVMFLHDKKAPRDSGIEVYTYRYAAIVALSILGYEVDFKTVYRKRRDWRLKYWWQKGVWSGK